MIIKMSRYKHNINIQLIKCNKIVCLKTILCTYGLHFKINIRTFEYLKIIIYITYLLLDLYNVYNLFDFN